MIAEEIWAKVPGHLGYEVSSDGRVRSLDRVVHFERRGKAQCAHRRGRLLRARRSSNGYLRVQLGDGPAQSVHRLVLQAFVGPCPGGCEAAHGDGRRDNNRLSNLRWATSKENHQDRIAHGNGLGGERGPAARLTREQVETIRSLAGQQSQVALARQFGVGQPHISSIIRGRTWK